jgi:hypothetical protein
MLGRIAITLAIAALVSLGVQTVVADYNAKISALQQMAFRSNACRDRRRSAFIALEDNWFSRLYAAETLVDTAKKSRMRIDAFKSRRIAEHAWKGMVCQ